MKKNKNYARNQLIRIIMKWIDKTEYSLADKLVEKKMRDLHHTWFSLSRRKNEQVISY